MSRTILRIYSCVLSCAPEFCHKIVFSANVENSILFYLCRMHSKFPWPSSVREACFILYSNENKYFLRMPSSLLFFHLVKSLWCDAALSTHTTHTHSLLSFSSNPSLSVIHSCVLCRTFLKFSCYTIYFSQVTSEHQVEATSVGIVRNFISLLTSLEAKEPTNKVWVWHVFYRVFFFFLLLYISHCSVATVCDWRIKENVKMP